MKHPYLLATLLVSCMVSPLSQVWAGGSLAQMEAKRLSKDGWRAEPGMPSIEDQLDSLYAFQEIPVEQTEQGEQLGIGSGKASTYFEAYQTAFLLALVDMQSHKQTSITYVDDLSAFPQMTNIACRQGNSDIDEMDAEINNLIEQKLIIHSKNNEQSLRTKMNFWGEFVHSKPDSKGELAVYGRYLYTNDVKNPRIIFSIYRQTKDGEIEVSVGVTDKKVQSAGNSDLLHQLDSILGF